MENATNSKKSFDKFFSFEKILLFITGREKEYKLKLNNDQKQDINKIKTLLNIELKRSYSNYFRRINNLNNRKKINDKLKEIEVNDENNDKKKKDKKKTKLLAYVLYKLCNESLTEITKPILHNNGNLFSQEFLQYLGTSVPDLKKKFEMASFKLTDEQAMIMSDLDNIKETKDLEKMDNIINCKTTLNFNFGMLTPLFIIIDKERSEIVDTNKKPVFKGLVKNFIELVGDHSELYLKNQSLIKVPQFKELSKNKKKERIIEDMINYKPGDKDIYYYSLEGKLWKNNIRRKQDVDFYLSSLGYALFTQSNLSIINTLVENGADIKNVWDHQKSLKFKGSNDAVTFITYLLKECFLINKDILFEKREKTNNSILNDIIKNTKNSIIETEEDSATTRKITFLNNQYQQKIKKFEETINKKIKNDEIQNSILSYISFSKINKNKKEKATELNKKRKSFYRYLDYVKGLMYYFLPMYQKQTNIQILGKNKISEQKVLAATKTFFFETLGSTAVDVLSAIDDQINENKIINFGTTRTNQNTFANLNKKKQEELIEKRKGLVNKWKKYKGITKEKPNEMQNEMQEKQNEEKRSKFCTSKLESKNYMCTGSVFQSSKNSLKLESLKGYNVKNIIKQLDIIDRDLKKLRYKTYVKSIKDQIYKQEENIMKNKSIQFMFYPSTYEKLSGPQVAYKMGDRIASSLNPQLDIHRVAYLLSWCGLRAFEAWCIGYVLYLLFSFEWGIIYNRIFLKRKILKHIQNYNLVMHTGGKKVLKKKPIKKSPVKKTVKKPLKKITKKSPTKKKTTTKKSTK